MMRLPRAFGGKVRRYMGARIWALPTMSPTMDSLAAEVETLSAAVNSLAGTDTSKAMQWLVQRGRQAEFLDRVDVTEHNRADGPARFDSLMCRAASAAECDDETYLAWWRLLENIPADLEPDFSRGPHQYNRKVWEWAFIVQSATQHNLMKPANRALGFGVGSEPLPALFARHGLDVVATDQGTASGEHWAATGELMNGLDGLRRPHLVSDDDLTDRVTTRIVDMNAVPADLGRYDIVWSSCVIEHLGSPERGLDFVLESCELLRPGGIAVHTTELELTRREDTADYGNCAVYRLADLQAFARRVDQAGYEARFNYHVAMDHPADRWVSLVGAGINATLVDRAHLKLVIGNSVSTSYGMVIRKPL